MTQTDKASITVGKTFKWELESNPSTGYSWQIDADELLTVTSDFVTKSDLCGAPGIQVISISTKYPGRYTVIAEYKRPWESYEPLNVRRLEIEFS